MPRLGSRTAVLAAAVLALAGCSTSYHAGDEAARDWDAWVKDHPLAGARVTDRVGTNVQPFQGTFEAYARLTAPATEKNIVKAMASMCRFNGETGSTTTYWLQIDAVSLQAPCDSDEQGKVAAFWTDVHTLPGASEIAFSSKGVAVTATDEAITGLVPQLSDAADASGWAKKSAVNDYTSEHVTITQKRNADLAEELKAAQDLIDAAGSAVKRIEVVAGRVSAATSGTVSQADDWQGQIASPVLTVTPAKVTTELPFSEDGRDLIDKLADDPRVLGINVVKAFWEIETSKTSDARTLISDLADEPAVSDLGHLQLDVGPSDYDSATGEGRMCFVRPDTAHPAHATAVLDLCDLKDVVEVDDRFDAALDLRQHSTDLKPVLSVLKKAPLGLPVYLQLPQGETYDFTTGATLQLHSPDRPATGELEKLWDSLPTS